MRKVIVIGCPGSGKSTFSKALHAKTGLPLVHLDRLYWNADRTTVDKAVFLARLDAALGEDAWIIDGNYASTMERRMATCDTVIFLDFEAAVCLEGIRARRGKAHSDLPWIEIEEDTALTALVQAFATEQRPTILALLEKHADKDVHIFTTRQQADAFVEQWTDKV